MNTALDPKVNLFSADLAAGIAAGAVSMTLEAGKGALLPDPAVLGAFNLVLFEVSTYYIPKDDPNYEIVRVTAKAGDVLTIVRAQEGTADVNHNTGGKTYGVILSITEKDFSDIETGKFNSMERIVSVAKSGGDFLTIQDAIDSISDATFVKRYTILVAPGIYSETVTLKPFIDIIGTGRNWNTTIQQVNATFTAAELQLMAMRHFEIQTLAVNFQNAGFVKAITLEDCYISTAATGVGQNNATDGHICQFINSAIAITPVFSGGIFVDSINTGWVGGGTFSSDTIFQSFGAELSGTYTLSDTAQAFIRAGSKLAFLQTFPAIYIAPSGTKLNIDGITFSTANTEQVADDALEIQDAISAGGIIPKAVITDNVDGTIDIDNFSVNLYNNSNQVGKPKRYDITGVDDQVLTDDSNNYISVDFNSGSPQLRFDTTDPSNESDIILLANIFREGNDLHIYELNTVGEGLSNKLNERHLDFAVFERSSGLILGEVATRVVTLTSGRVYSGASPIDLTAFNSGSHIWDFYAHVSSVWTKNPAGATTQYNNTQYDDGTDLVSLGVNKYTVNWIYRDIDSDAHSIYVLGDAEYVSLATAQLAAPPTDLPEIAAQHSILVGRIIVQNGASSGVVESAFTEVFSPSAVQNHNDLAGIQGGAAANYYHLKAARLPIIGNYAADAGGTDAYAITIDPAPGSYTTGMVVYFKANTANTGAATLNVNSLGAKTIKKNFNEDLTDNDIKAGQIVAVEYDGTNFQILSFLLGDILSLTRYGGAGIFQALSANGSNASPTAILDGDTLGNFRFGGYDGVLFAVNAAILRAVATQNWDGSSHGCKYEVRIAPNGSTTPATVIIFENDGSLKLEEYQSLKERASAPSNEASYGKIYVKTDKGLYYLDEDGNEIPLIEKYIELRAIDKDTDLAVDTNVFGDFRVPKGMIVLAVGAYVDTAGTTGVSTIDINEAGTTILSTKITIDSGEKSSETAATPPVISDAAIAADAILTIDIDGVSTTEPKGLTVWLKVAVKA